jgi:hypothetical protein
MYKNLPGDPERQRHLVKLVVNGRIILKYIFDEKYLRMLLCISIGYRLSIKHVKQVTL